MLNGFTTIRQRSSARFSGVAVQIGISFNQPLINTANYLASYVWQTLTANGWQVLNVTPHGAGRFLARVMGNTSDNLRSVETAFLRTLNNNQLQSSNAVAEFINLSQPTPTQTPTQPTQPPITQVVEEILVQFAISPNWTILSSSALTDAITSALENRLAYRNVTQISGGTLTGAVYRVQLRYFASNSTTQQQINLLENALAPVGTVSNIQVIGNSVIGVGGAGGDKDDKDNNEIEDFLSDLGNKLGFSAAGALVGGGLVAVVIAFLVLKK